VIVGTRFAEKTLEELREHLIALIYSTRLQESGIHQTPADFASSSKEGLVGLSQGVDCLVGSDLLI
jgi:hypothetical protein